MKPTTKQKGKVWKVSLFVLFVALALLADFGFWLYGGGITQAKIKIFSVLPLPMASVNGQFVPMKDFLQRKELAAKIPGQNASELDLKKTLAVALIYEAKISQLVKERGQEPVKAQIEEAYGAYLKQPSFKEQLAGTGLSEGGFKKIAIIPELNLINLQTWFNSQKNLNEKSYKTAEEILVQLQSGKNMAELARQVSEDPTGRDLKGDLGFVEAATLLAELREPIEQMKEGEAKIVPSRFGLHILKLEEKQNNTFHIRQIFIKPSNFKAWLDTQTAKLKVKTFINI